METYKLLDEASMLTPNILLYPKLVEANIAMALKNCRAENLRPHIKTIKCRELVGLLLKAGITKFKCATINEAELLAEISAGEVLLAYPLVGANVSAFLDLVDLFPRTKFQVLVDSVYCAQVLNEQAAVRGVSIAVFIDLNLGMNRTGVVVDEGFDFGLQVSKFSNLNVVGLHGYDGHIQDYGLNERFRKVKPLLEQVLQLYKQLQEALYRKLKLVLGGSNTFPIYRALSFVECSPGTFMLWDWGYASILKEQPFHFGAVLVSRVISKPAHAILCLDLGHKAIAAENAIERRMHFLGHEDWKAVSQSEEHLIVEVPEHEWDNVNVGEMQYIIPYHICPTVAKYPRFQVIKAGKFAGEWVIAQRYNPKKP